MTDLALGALAVIVIAAALWFGFWGVMLAAICAWAAWPATLILTVLGALIAGPWGALGGFLVGGVIGAFIVFPPRWAY